MNIWQLWSWLKCWRNLLMGFLAIIMLTGCATSPPQNPYLYTGAGIGALLGGGLGAAINNRDPWKGAAIGALLGGAGGAVAGEWYGRSNPYPGYQSGYGSQGYGGYYGGYNNPQPQPNPNYGAVTPQSGSNYDNGSPPAYSQAPPQQQPGYRPPNPAYYTY